MPDFTHLDLIRKLGLDGPEPDGLELIERLLGNNHKPSFKDLRSVLLLQRRQLPNLLETTNS